MIFASDNWAGASDKIIDALAEAARSGGPAYGGDALTADVQARICDLFEHDAAVFFVASGTVANALALSAYARPGGIFLAHREAHVLVDEAGAAEFFSGGNRVLGLDADLGKLSPDTLAASLGRLADREVHHGQPVAVSLTQITEYGTVYRPDEVAALAGLAHEHKLKVHMDGARFAGAMAALDVSPGDVTWRAGVDVLAFGGTKNGCIAAEAVIFFNPDDARDFAFARQRAGQGYSKNWFIAAQFGAYLDGGHWLELAGQANRMAARLATAIDQSDLGRLALVPEANEVFAILATSADARLREAGAKFYPWTADGFSAGARAGADEVMVRLVTSFQTSEAEVDRFAAVLQGRTP